MTRRGADQRRIDERGSAMVEFTWLALLLMVPLLYLLLSVFEVQRGSFAVSDGTRAAARAYSLAPSPGAGQERARAAVRQALADQGVEGVAPRIRITCTPSEACLQPGSTVTVRVSARVALPLAPAVFGSGAPGVRVSAVQTVPFGSYRPGREATG
ncbi:hypothetical protein [Nocardioides insulae]|uniref:hypothetical protein n=1 Tax=Nocardioides insulae TaxID=394734 RepID=UPI0004140B11|nr:hypothetical protein [Nocardioides insulae]